MVKKGQLSIIAIVAAGQTLGYMTSIILPFVIGGLIDEHRFTVETAGRFASLGLLGIAIGAALTSGVLNRIDRRTTLLASALLAAIGFGLLAASDSAPSLYALNLVVGLVCGVALAVANAVGGTAEDPDRLFGKVAILTGLLGGGIVFGASLAAASAGIAGVFAFLSGLSLVCLVVALMVPAASPIMDAPSFARSDNYAESGASWNRRALWIALAILACAVFFQAAWQGLWSFGERIGDSINLSLEESGAILGGANVIGIFGALAATLVGARFGRLLPMVVCGLGLLIAGWFFSNPGSGTVYAIMAFSWCFWFYFFTPLLLAAASVADDSGRCVAAVGGIGLAGAAAGPAVCGWVAFHYGLGIVGVVILTLIAIGLICISAATYALDRRKISI